MKESITLSEYLNGLLKALDQATDILAKCGKEALESKRPIEGETLHNIAKDLRSVSTSLSREITIVVEQMTKRD